MKNITIIALVITFCSTLAVPQTAMGECTKFIAGFTLLGAGLWAGSAIMYGNTDIIGEEILIGAGLGAVAGLLLCAITSAKQSSQGVEKPDEEWKLTENPVFVPHTFTSRPLSYPRDYDKQAVFLFSFKVEF